MILNGYVVNITIINAPTLLLHQMISLGFIRKRENYNAKQILDDQNSFELANTNVINIERQETKAHVQMNLFGNIEILQGDIKKSLMIGDSETDANAAKNAGIPVILMEDGYTEKKTNEIYHNHLVKDFIGIEKIVSKYL